jgi:hypothetical protein
MQGDYRSFDCASRGSIRGAFDEQSRDGSAAWQAAPRDGATPWKLAKRGSRPIRWRPVWCPAEARAWTVRLRRSDAAGGSGQALVHRDLRTAPPRRPLHTCAPPGARRAFSEGPSPRSPVKAEGRRFPRNDPQARMLL